MPVQARRTPPHLTMISRSTAALLLLAAAGCRAPRAAPPPPAPELPPGVNDEAETRLLVCVVQGGRITTVAMKYDPATGDSTIGGRTFAEAYPPTAEHAATAPWYVAYEPIEFQGHRYLEYGLPRVLSAHDLAPAGSYRGVAVFVEPGDRLPYTVLYLPVSPDCLFQPYYPPEVGGAVRG